MYLAYGFYIEKRKMLISTAVGKKLRYGMAFYRCGLKMALKMKMKKKINRIEKVQ